VNYLMVGLGGILGAISRYALSSSISGLNVTTFPYGTLSVNLIGSFLLSFIAYGSSLKCNLPKRYILAINTGLIGSFTTFSTFSVETLNLMINGKYIVALTYVLISVISGLTLSWFGIYASTKIFQKVEQRGRVVKE